MAVRTVTLYTKPNCPLCDEALEQIERAQSIVPFNLVEINILTDPSLYQRYKLDIPVICLDGAELFRHRLKSEELIRRLQS